jgi:lysozyme
MTETLRRNMPFYLIREDLIRDEGWVPHVYDDHLGFATLGFGFLVDQRRGGGIPRDVAEYWLDKIIANNRAELTRDYPWFAASPEPVRRALENMRYQLGRSGLANFRRMLSALQAGQYAEAARQALDSKWAAQTPARAQRIAALIRSADVRNNA